jgi:ligand-binding sensor domain-containing protein
VLHEGKPIWINRIYRDRQDRMWVASNEHGLYRLDGGKFEKVRY